MKKTFLVSFCPMTRVTVEVPDNFDENNLSGTEIEEELVNKARENIMFDIENYLNFDNLDTVKEDTECPYNSNDAVWDISDAEIGTSINLPDEGICLTKIKTPETEWAVVVHEEGEGDFTNAVFIPSSEFDDIERVKEAVKTFKKQIILQV